MFPRELEHVLVDSVGSLPLITVGYDGNVMPSDPVIWQGSCVQEIVVPESLVVWNVPAQQIAWLQLNPAAFV
jgi:hypothetical protein